MCQPEWPEGSVHGIVGLGGIMKSTLTVGRLSTCYVSHYLGTLDTIPAMDNAAEVLRHMLSVLGVSPQLFVCDEHPHGLGASLVQQGIPLICVQHHHAHAVACMAENHHHGKAIGVVFDGLGLGPDGSIWGGEFLLVDRLSYQRIGHCATMPMPGGDAATLYPGRMALGALFSRFADRVKMACPWMDDAEKQGVIELLEKGVNVPETSSMGRLFDACAALLDVNRKRSYQGQPAIELEAMADGEVDSFYPVMDTFDPSRGFILDGPQILALALDDFLAGTERSIVAARFHNTIAQLTAAISLKAAEMYHVDAICLSGGCFQNRLLYEKTLLLLEKKRIKTLVHRLFSPGDECISFGQVMIAAERNIKGDDDVSCHTG